MTVLAWTLVAGWLVQAAAATLGCAWYLRLLDRPQPWPDAWPPVLVVVPVRGPGPVLDAFLDGLVAQDHPAWRAVLVVEDAADPAHAVIATRVARAGAPLALRVAGATPGGRGQKVHNLLAGLDALRPDDGALVTLDADMVPPPDLLRALLRPVLTGQGGIASGYRWSVAADARWGSRLLARIDVGIATLPRHAGLNLCWGGATAIGREALDRLDLRRVWDGAVSDDLALTRAARGAGLGVYAPLTVRPASPVALGVADVWRFGVRQYRLLRVHAWPIWVMAGGLIVLPVAGVVAAMALGWRVAMPAFGIAVGLGMARAGLRASIADRVLPPAAAAEVRQARWTAAGVAPVATLLHLAAWGASAFGHTVRWAGRRHRLRAPS